MKRLMATTVGILAIYCLVMAALAIHSHAQSVAKPAQSCIDSPCTLSLNYPYDAVGEPDQRAGTWGTASFDDGKIQFTNVPAGHRVRIERVYGNWTARVHGKAPADTYAGVLFGLITTATDASPYATLSQKGCMLYLQADVGAGQAHVESFDVNTHAAGLLEADHVLIVRRATYLNETGQSIHQEPSMVIEFRYEKESVGA